MHLSWKKAWVAAAALVLPAPAHDERREAAAAGEDVPAVVAPDPSCVVEVFVRADESGLPIGGAAVSCDGEPVAETDAQGRARFSVDGSGRHTVRATAPGRCAGLDRVETRAGTVRVEASLALVPAAAVHGLVRRPDGAPARGAEVVLHLQRPRLVRPVASGVDGLPSGARVRTDAEGAFRFDGIGSDEGVRRARVTVLHDGCARFESEPFDLRNGEVVGPLLCDLRDGARIRGRVTASSGGVRATVFLAGVGAPIATDAEGSYELLHVPPGPATLCASLDAHPGIRAAIALDVLPGEERVQNVALDYEMAAFTGVVSTPDGVRLPDVRVWCEMQRFGSDEPVRYATRARSDGTYRLEIPMQLGEAEPLYTLRLERWENDCAVTASPPPWVQDLACTGSAMVELTAVDSAAGGPLALFEWPVWVPAADPAADFVLLDYESRPGGGLVAAVPAVAGELELTFGSAGYVTHRRLSLTARPGEHVDLGRVDFDPER